MDSFFHKWRICGPLMIAAGALFSSPSVAADLDAKAAPVLASPNKFPPVGSVHDWTGAYIGAQIGIGFQRTNDFSVIGVPDALAGPPDGDSATGILGGLYGGYNVQSGRFVYGFDVDISGTSLSSDLEGDLTGVGDPAVDIADVNVFTLGSAQLRFGYAFDRLLPYVLGGFTSSVNRIQLDTGEDDTRAHFGWTGGAGLEYAVTDRLSTRLQYSFSRLNTRDYFDTIEFNHGGVHAVRAGVSFNTSGLINRFGRR